MPTFNLHYEWLSEPATDEAFGPDRNTWAQLSLLVDGINLTAHRHADGPRTSGDLATGVVGGLAGVADWLVENWLYIFWEIHTPFPKVVAGHEGTTRVPSLRDALDGWSGFLDQRTSPEQLAHWQHRHSLGHAASDLALPSLVFLPEDKLVGVAVAHPPLGLEPNIRFERVGPDGRGWPRDPVWVSKDELELTLAGLVNATIERASQHQSSRSWGEWLRSRFQAARSSAADSQTRRKLLLGEFVATAWDDCERRLGEDAPALSGVLIDSEMVRGQAELEGVVSAIHGALTRTGSPSARLRDFQGPPGDRLLPPFERGYRLATWARQELREPKRPFNNLRGALAQFGVTVEPFIGPPLFRSAAVVSNDGRAAVLHNDGNERFAGVAPTRFALAAALGRMLAEGPLHRGAFGAAHGSQARWTRTQEANAFAAEFLLPKAALEENADIGALSEEYGISRTAAEHHRENRLSQTGA